MVLTSSLIGNGNYHFLKSSSKNTTSGTSSCAGKPSSYSSSFMKTNTSTKPTAGPDQTGWPLSPLPQICHLPSVPRCALRFTTHAFNASLIPRRAGTRIWPQHPVTPTDVFCLANTPERTLSTHSKTQKRSSATTICHTLVFTAQSPDIGSWQKQAAS